MRAPYAAVLAVWLVLVPAVLRGQGAAPTFQYFGEWSGVQVTSGEDPHAYGLSLDLWKSEEQIVGMLNEYGGAVADPFLGPLQDVHFNAQSGQLSFSAKMSDGIVLSAASKNGEWARTMYVFAGQLTSSEIRGTLEKQDHLNNGPATREAVVWKARETHNDFWNNKTLRDWETFYALLLTARGPRW